MKYTIMMGCGHEDVVELFGKGADRKRKIEYFKKSGLCKECYKESMAAATKAAGLVFNASVLPHVDQTDGSIQVSVWFSGDTKPHKDEIKALGGYRWDERESGEDWFELRRPSLCWTKTIKMEALDEEVSKALSIGAKVKEMDSGFSSTINYQLALLAQESWKEKKGRIDALVKPIAPAVIKGRRWNQKVYGKPGNHSIYPDGEKVCITDEQADELDRYVHAKAEYLKKVQEIRDSSC